MKYLLDPLALGTMGAALLQQLREVQHMTGAPSIPLARVSSPRARPSPSKVFSTRGRRRLGLLAAERKAKRKAQKAARRKNRAR